MRNINARLESLASRLADNRSEIPVWCWEESEMEEAINRMIARGEIAQADRSRCVYWASVKSRTPGAHERALAELAKS